MFDKIGRLAEAAATNVSVSRRGFFGQLGRGALVVAGALGGLLGTAVPAQAGNPAQSCGRCGKCYPPATGCVILNVYCGGYPVPKDSGHCLWDCSGTFIHSDCVR
jgi:hypothetical protein